MGNERLVSRLGYVRLLGLTLFTFLASVSGCGGADSCRQCGSCALSVWPRLVVGLTADGENVAAKDATVRIQVWDDHGEMVTSDPADFGTVVGPDYCQCMSDLTNVHCTRAYTMAPNRHVDLVLKVLSSGTEIGVCPVSLARHNYCGVDITSVDIQIDSNSHVTCGASTRFNVCP